MALLARRSRRSPPSRRRHPTFTKDVAPIFQAKCEACHRPDSIAPMSLVRPTNRPGRYARAIKNSRRDAPDAAVAHRQDRRHSEVQERPVAERRSRSTRSSAGWTPARRRATRRTCRAAVKWPTEQGWNFAAMFGQTEPDLDHQVHAVPAEGGRAGRVVETDRRDRSHGSALGARDRDSSRRQ